MTELCCILIAAYAVFLLRYFAHNGICLNVGTGRIAGNQSAGAGALPRVYDAGFLPFLSLDLARPFSSGSALASVFICSVVVLWLLRLIIKKDRERHRTRDIAILTAVLALIILTYCSESVFSCELLHTHLNIEYIYSRKNVDSIDYLNFASSGIDSDARGVELKGRNGEPACRAFVVSTKFDNKGLDNEWVHFNKTDAANGKLSEPLSLVVALYDKTHLDDLYFSVRSFRYDGKTVGMLGHKLYSIIGCLTWPYPWYDELP